MKNKNLYLKSGYLDFAQIVDDDCPFAFVIGGRGTGKTYGALEYCRNYFETYHKPFIYMRRSSIQADLMATEVFNPFKKLNEDKGWNVQPFKITKSVDGFFNAEIDGDKLKPAGPYMAVIAALSTFSNFRGFDGSNIDIVIYDEFIRNKGEKSIKDEGFALMNVFETINRNRELMGGTPVKLICLSNSNFIGNDVFIDLGLVHHAEYIREKKRNQYYDFGRGIAIYDLIDSPISKRKKDTALYRMDNGGAYSDMAIGNSYEDYDKSLIGSRPIKEYVPRVKYGEITIYSHKSNNTFYCTFHSSGTCQTFTDTKINKERFIRVFSFLWEVYLRGEMIFESYMAKKLFENIFCQ